MRKWLIRLAPVMIPIVLKRMRNRRKASPPRA
jgi:hypothetical protein